MLSGKRVLVISFYSFPSNETASHRPCKLAKYLARCGWTPILLTVRWEPMNCDYWYDPILAAMGDVCETIRVPYNGTSRGIPRRFLGKCLSVLPRLLWPFKAPWSVRREMLTAADLLMSQQPVDAIWSTFGPGLDLDVADTVSRKHRIPWVADFRDLPDQFGRTWRSSQKVRAEVRVCASAAALTTVSQGLADRLAKRHLAPVSVVPHMFDPDDYPPVTATQSSKFTIAYFGRVYRGRSVGQDARPLFAALDRLVELGQVSLDDVRVEFYGADRTALEDSTKGYKSATVVQWHPQIPHREALLKQQQATLLLLLCSPAGAGIMNSKLTSYLGARRPILAVPGDRHVTDEVLSRTESGRTAASPLEIAELLAEWYREWKATGAVAFHGIDREIGKFSSVAQAVRLAKVLDTLSGGPRWIGRGATVSAARSDLASPPAQGTMGQ